MIEKRKFARLEPTDIKGCLICWQKTAFIEIENLSMGGVKLKELPHGIIGQVGQIYFPLEGFGEVFADFRCLQRTNGAVRLMFQNLSYSELKVIGDYIEFYDLSYHHEDYLFEQIYAI